MYRGSDLVPWNDFLHFYFRQRESCGKRRSYRVCMHLNRQTYLELRKRFFLRAFRVIVIVRLTKFLTFSVFYSLDHEIESMFANRYNVLRIFLFRFAEFLSVTGRNWPRTYLSKSCRTSRREAGGEFEIQAAYSSLSRETLIKVVSPTGFRHCRLACFNDRSFSRIPFRFIVTANKTYLLRIKLLRTTPSLFFIKKVQFLRCQRKFPPRNLYFLPVSRNPCASFTTWWLARRIRTYVLVCLRL